MTNLELLHESELGLSHRQKDAMSQALIGALSVVVEQEVWKSCIANASNYALKYVEPESEFERRTRG